MAADTSANTIRRCLPSTGQFQKRVCEQLYRNSASGTYVAHLRLNGRVIKESLDTTVLVVA